MAEERSSAYNVTPAQATFASQPLIKLKRLDKELLTTIKKRQRCYVDWFTNSFKADKLVSYLNKEDGSIFLPLEYKSKIKDDPEDNAARVEMKRRVVIQIMQDAVVDLREKAILQLDQMSIYDRAIERRIQALPDLSTSEREAMSVKIEAWKIQKETRAKKNHSISILAELEPLGLPTNGPSPAERGATEFIIASDANISSSDIGQVPPTTAASRIKGLKRLINKGVRGYEYAISKVFSAHMKLASFLNNNQNNLVIPDRFYTIKPVPGESEEIREVKKQAVELSFEKHLRKKKEAAWKAIFRLYRDHVTSSNRIDKLIRKCRFYNDEQKVLVKQEVETWTNFIRKHRAMKRSGALKKWLASIIESNNDIPWNLQDDNIPGPSSIVTHDLQSSGDEGSEDEGSGDEDSEGPARKKLKLQPSILNLMP